jgi:hypothetical protein
LSLGQAWSNHRNGHQTIARLDGERRITERSLARVTDAIAPPISANTSAAVTSLGVTG